MSYRTKSKGVCPLAWLYIVRGGRARNWTAKNIQGRVITIYVIGPTRSVQSKCYRTYELNEKLVVRYSYCFRTTEPIDDRVNVEKNEPDLNFFFNSVTPNLESILFKHQTSDGLHAVIWFIFYSLVPTQDALRHFAVIELNFILCITA